MVRGLPGGEQRRRWRRAARSAGTDDRLRDRTGGVEAGAVEGVAHRRRGPEPGRRLAGEAAVDHVVEGLGDLGALGADRGRGGGEPGHGGGDLGVAAERWVADSAS